MNEPKRLLVESQSQLLSQMLHAAQREELPADLRERMARGLSLAAGGAVLGALTANGSVGGAAAGLGVPTVLSAGAATVTSGVNGAHGASALGVGALGGKVTAGVAGPMTWLKGTLVAVALTGAIGGTVLLQGQDAPPVLPRPAAAAPAPAAVPEGLSEVQVEPLKSLSASEPMVPVSEDGETDVTQRKVGRVKVRKAAAGSAPTTAPGVETLGDLGREVRLLDAARQSIRSGDLEVARAKLAQYEASFPNGSLRAEAASLARAAAR